MPLCACEPRYTGYLVVYVRLQYRVTAKTTQDRIPILPVAEAECFKRVLLMFDCLWRVLRQPIPHVSWPVVYCMA